MGFGGFGGIGELIQLIFTRIQVTYVPGPGGSVPGPETLLAFGLGFAAFVVWRAKRVEE